MTLEKHGKEGYIDINGEIVCDDITEIAGVPLKRQILAASATIAIQLAVGATSGYSAILLPQLQSSDSNLDSTMMSWVAAISPLPLFIANITSGYLMGKYGRKKSQIFLAVPYFIGWSIIGLATNIYMILLGRFITGFCQGWSGPLAPVFVAEISTPRYRGVLLSMLSLAIAVGIFISHLLGTFLHWKLAALCCGVFPCIAFTILMFVPESPSWYLSKDCEEEATRAFLWYRGNNTSARTELQRMLNQKRKEIELEEMNLIETLRYNLRKPEFRKPLLAMVVFFLITQLSGVNVYSSYTAHIMKMLVGNQFNEYTAMLLIDSIRVFALVCSGLCMRHLGRRPLANLSGGLTALTLITLASYLYAVNAKFLSHPMPIISLLLMCFNIFISSVGIVPLPWIMVGEVFPIATRGLGSGISVMVTSVSFFLTVKTALYLIECLALEGTLMFYGICTLLGTIFLYYELPETKGKTLQQVEDGFKSTMMDNVCRR